MEAYIDGDMLVYRSAFSNETETRWNDDIHTLHTDTHQAIAYVDDMIESICNTIKVDNYLVAFTAPNNFRTNLLPSYKSNRKSKRKPLGLKTIIEATQARHPTIIIDNIEADDVIGIMCTRNPNTTIAVSGDKDFATLPITWYNFLNKETKTLSLEEANYNHLVQTLTGDKVDGFEGIKGVGPVTARKILDKEGASWATIVDAYQKKGLTEYDALLTARMAYILRNENYIEGEIKLWLPNK